MTITKKNYNTITIEPQVSVIIPNYNHALFLQQRIESILCQTFHNFELIILDDHSTDNSKKIIEMYRNHPKVSQIVYNTENSGSTFKQWQKGIDLAKGEYIWIAESDDWCEPSLLETLVSKLELNKNIVLGYVQSYFIIDDKIMRVSKQDYLERIIDGSLFIKQHLLYRNAIFNASMAIFSKSAFYKIDNAYTDFKFCGDLLFWGMIASQGQVFISGKILNYFRKHSGDVSNGAYAIGLNYLEVIDVLSLFYQKNYIEESEFRSSLKSKYIDFILKKEKLTQNQILEIQNKFNEHIKINKYVKWIIILGRKSKKNIITTGRKCYKKIKMKFL